MHTATGAPARPSADRRAERPVFAPRIDIYESDTDVRLVADLPGVPEGNVRLHLERDELLLEATTQLADSLGEAVAQEFGNVDYRRVFRLPKGVDADNIRADHTNGVLTVHLPKSASAQPRRIEVRSV